MFLYYNTKMEVNLENGQGPDNSKLSVDQQDRLHNYDSLYHDVRNTSTVFKNIGPLIENAINEKTIDTNTANLWKEIKPYSSAFLELIDFQKKATTDIANNNLQNNIELFAIINKQYKQLSLEAIDINEFTSSEDPFYPPLALYSQKMHEISNNYKFRNSNDFQKYLQSAVSSVQTRIQEIPFWQKHLENNSIPEIKNEPINILNLTLDIIRDVKNIGVNKDHPIRIIDYPNQEDIILNTDKRFLRQIIENLIYNSCKYSKNNNDPIIVDCNPQQISIIDKGIGFSPQDAEIINKFEPEIRTENAKEHALGTGLGLPFAKRCADALGYELIGQSNGVDQGATFTLKYGN